MLIPKKTVTTATPMSAPYAPFAPMSVAQRTTATAATTLVSAADHRTTCPYFAIICLAPEGSLASLLGWVCPSGASLDTAPEGAIPRPRPGSPGLPRSTKSITGLSLASRGGACEAHHKLLDCYFT